MVATPIGNLDDITLRALKVLESADVVACEDTRYTSRLLSHYNLKKRTIACHAHNEENSAKGIIELLAQGLNIAYCSDAGTPGISDPGAHLAEEVRKAGFDVVPIPGPSALVTLLSAAGRIGKTFTFEGFLSPKKGRREKRLKTLIERGETFVVYESPFRIVKTMEEIAILAPTAKVVCGRELTKAFEEFLVGQPSQVLAALNAKDAIKGEFAFAVIPQERFDDNSEEA